MATHHVVTFVGCVLGAALGHVVTELIRRDSVAGAPRITTVLSAIERVEAKIDGTWIEGPNSL